MQALDRGEVSRSLVVPVPRSAPPTGAARARRVIEVDVRRQAPHAGVAERASEAAARYRVHGTDLLDRVPEPGSTTVPARRAAADGWTLVGRWLTCVAVLGVLAVALALLGDPAVR